MQTDVQLSAVTQRFLQTVMSYSIISDQTDVPVCLWGREWGGVGGGDLTMVESLQPGSHSKGQALCQCSLFSEWEKGKATEGAHLGGFSDGSEGWSE